jgi:hypothetical protein
MKAKILKLKKGTETIVHIKSNNTAIPNMIRTIIKTEIECYAVDVENIEYGECDVIFPIERISNVIGLIPVKQNLSKDVTFSLHAEFDKNKVSTNDTCFEPRNMITSDDIKSSNDLKYFHPGMPIVELRKNAGKLNIDKITLIKKNQLYNARHQTCKIYYEIIQENDSGVTVQLTLKQ